MLLRRIARPLFASWFVAEGWDAVRRPAPHTAEARRALEQLPWQVPDLTDRQLTSAVQAHGAAVAGAGLLLATGRVPRLAALALTVLTAPLVVVGLTDLLRPGGRSDPAHRRARRDKLVRALAFTGGAALVAADHEGRPGVAWRVQHFREQRAAAADADAE